MGVMEEDPRVGALLGDRYRIETRLAAGGMGAVYRATQIALDRAVAVKFLHGWMSLDVRARRRFEVEAQAMAKLRHPHCAQVLDFGVDGETPYLVMELVEGETLGDLLERGPLPPSRAVAIARQALSALAHAHQQGITHRDIKPDNLMIGEATAVGDHVRILDFGIARLAEDGSALTAGMAIGTPKYMAPEQASGEQVDARTDLYAMAVVLYQMLVGEPPFVAEETIDILCMHREAPPPRVVDKAPHVPVSPELEAAIQRALAKRPDDRFQDALAFAEALGACPESLQRPSSAPFVAASDPVPLAATPHLDPAGRLLAPAGAEPTPGARAAAWLRTHPVLALVLAATVGAVIVAVALAEGEVEARQQAQEQDIPRASAPGAGAGEPEGLAAARELIEERPDRAASRLEAITSEYEQNAEAWYLLGRAYFARMWWTEGLGAFRRAIALDEAYRAHAALIETVLDGFISRRAHGVIADFLVEEIGAPAKPHLEALARDASSARVRERASAALARLGG
jgi:eukaryotic-like serine/threonine-protein kinase